MTLTVAQASACQALQGVVKTLNGSNGYGEWQIVDSDEDFECYIEHGEDPFENSDDEVYEDPD
jgi:hypothetical protein